MLAKHHNEGEPFFFDDEFLGELEDNLIEEMTENCTGLPTSERFEYLTRIKTRLQNTLEELSPTDTSEGRDFRDALEYHTNSIFKYIETNSTALVSGTELLDIFRNTMTSYHEALDKIVIRLQESSSLQQLKMAQRVLFNDKNRLHITTPFLYDEFAGGDLLLQFVKEKFQELHNRYDDALRLIDLQIEQSYADLNQLSPIVENELGQSPGLSSRPTLLDGKIEFLTNRLTEVGFFRLEKVALLSEKDKKILVELIASTPHKTPYIIAMFDYLGFIKELGGIFTSQTAMHKNIAEWLGLSPGTAVDIKKYILALNPKSSYSKDDRYKKAPGYKELAQKDYETIKKGGKPLF